MSNTPQKPRHEHGILNFPKDFLWGTASSAYQVEGNNIYADWWEWEKTQPEKNRSGKAIDQYNCFKEDFELAKDLNLNAQRLSIEWSRIEPVQGQFDQAAIDHYKQVFKELKAKNFQIMLTLWHVTLPKWLADKGGWESFSAPGYFEKFVEKIIPEFKEYIDLWITINEPGIYTFMTYLGGSEVGPFPPAKKSNFSAIKATINLARAHKAAYKAIHRQIKDPQVGIAQNIATFDPTHKHSLTEQAAVLLSDFFTNHSFYCLTGGYHDFFGVNYYFHYRYNSENSLIPKIESPIEQKQDVSDLGWEIYPEGLFDAIMDISDGIPIYVTEAGIASTNDDRRTRFLISFVQEVYRVIQSGVNVKGFFYWTLIDDFEWERGFDPRFGLIEVDYKTMKRYVRPSALVYAEIAKQNGIPHKLLKLLGHGLQVDKEIASIIKEDKID